MERGIIEDEPDTALPRELQQDLKQVRLVQVVREHVQVQFLVRQHFIQYAENLLPGRETQPFVFLLKRELLAGRVDTGFHRRIEQQLPSLGPDGRLETEVVNERLRLSKSAREAKLESVLLKRRHVDVHSRAQRRIDRF